MSEASATSTPVALLVVTVLLPAVIFTVSPRLYLVDVLPSPILKPLLIASVLKRILVMLLAILLFWTIFSRVKRSSMRLTWPKLTASVSSIASPTEVTRLPALSRPVVLLKNTEPARTPSVFIVVAPVATLSTFTALFSETLKPVAVWVAVMFSSPVVSRKESLSCFRLTASVASSASPTEVTRLPALSRPVVLLRTTEPAWIPSVLTVVVPVVTLVRLTASFKATA